MMYASAPIRSLRGTLDSRILRLRARGDVRRSSAGFTLIEMIVALAILSLSLGVLFSGFSQALDRIRFNHAQMAARLLAQALIAESGTNALKLGIAHGIASDGLIWNVAVVPFGSPMEQKAWSPTPAQVTATVTWSENGTEHSLSLTTLRFLAGEVQR